jgi:acetylornithine deacetylase/succinyl-diaminopimelate desuccinylase-like protein
MAPAAHFDRAFWAADGNAVDWLKRFIRIDALSPGFDPQWFERGKIRDAQALLAQFVTAELPGSTATVHTFPAQNAHRTGLDRWPPLLAIDYRGSGSGYALFYSHADRQPEDPEGGARKWTRGGPWAPEVVDGRLYGRGASDDGYGLFAAVYALKYLRAAGRDLARAVILVEGGEESGSGHLLDELRQPELDLGVPELVFILDSGAGSWRTAWETVSLRGVLVVDVTIRTAGKSIHSGEGSGSVADPARVEAILRSRLEDVDTGEIRVPELQIEITDAIRSAARKALEAGIHALPEHIEGAGPMHADPVEDLIARTWKSTVTRTMLSGVPTRPGDASNLIYPEQRVRFSIRLAPGIDGNVAQAAVLRELRKPVRGAIVEVNAVGPARTGYRARAAPPWLADALSNSSRTHFGQDAAAFSEGGTIPIAHQIQTAFPQATLLVTGVLGPGSGAHSVDEFLDLGYAANLSAVLGDCLAEFAVSARS